MLVEKSEKQYVVVNKYPLDVGARKYELRTIDIDEHTSYFVLKPKDGKGLTLLETIELEKEMVIRSMDLKLLTDEEVWNKIRCDAELNFAIAEILKKGEWGYAGNMKFAGKPHSVAHLGNLLGEKVEVIEGRMDEVARSDL